MIDYYEFLQISPHADAETIHRVYRYLAGRLHPDNPESGDPEMFRLLKSAYDVLSSPSKRSDYDAACKREAPEVNPLSTSIDFMDSLDGELNRRVAVLAVLYFRRRENPRMPEVALGEIERRMGFPRDYLDFTTWYLQKKGYITRADNSDFTLTADGVDYVETQRGSLPVLNKLLTDGKRKSSAGSSRAASNGQASHKTPIIVPAPEVRWKDRRAGTFDRRSGVIDLLDNGMERRLQGRDRRVNKIDRRVGGGDRRAYALVNT
jgi:curved DNA-binding protein